MLFPLPIQLANAVVQSAVLFLAVDACSIQTPSINMVSSDPSENSQQTLSGSFVIKSIAIFLMCCASMVLVKHICQCIMALSINSGYPEVHFVLAGSSHWARQAVVDSQMTFTALHKVTPHPEPLFSRADAVSHRQMEGVETKYKAKIRAPTAGKHAYSEFPATRRILSRAEAKDKV